MKQLESSLTLTQIWCQGVIKLKSQGTPFAATVSSGEDSQVSLWFDWMHARWLKIVSSWIQLGDWWEKFLPLQTGVWSFSFSSNQYTGLVGLMSQFLIQWIARSAMLSAVWLYEAGKCGLKMCHWCWTVITAGGWNCHLRIRHWII